MSENKVWSLVWALRWYLHRTHHYKVTTLRFHYIRKPFTGAAQDTISEWIVETIARAVPDLKPMMLGLL